MKQIKQKISEILPEKAKQELKNSANKASNHKFGIFIFSSLLIAFILVGVSLWMYENFGAAQLDLSRPSLQEAREQAKKQAEAEKLRAKKEETFETEGKIDSKSMSKFEKLYSQKIEKIDGDFFGEGALSDETLNLTDENKGEN